MIHPTGEAERVQVARKHVFVVNGDPAFLDVVRELLQDESFNVTTTNYVPNTFAMVKVLQPDLLIIDLVVGQVSGWELLDRLHEAAVTRGLPVLVTSTDPSLLERAQAEAERYGSHAVLAKPFEVDQLLDAVQQLVGTADR
jgi:CheY-like chemotaxis protein